MDETHVLAEVSAWVFMFTELEKIKVSKVAVKGVFWCFTAALFLKLHEVLGKDNTLCKN